MTDLEVRRPKFDFTEDVPWEWNPQNPAFSFFMNATSIIAICFEQMIVAAVQEAKPLITDPEVAAEATAFLRQEAQHSSTHRKHVNALIKRYPGLQQTLDDAVASYRRSHGDDAAEVPPGLHRRPRGDLYAQLQDDARQRRNTVPPWRRPGRVTVHVALRRRGRAPQLGAGDLRRGGRKALVPNQGAPGSRQAPDERDGDHRRRRQCPRTRS